MVMHLYGYEIIQLKWNESGVVEAGSLLSCVYFMHDVVVQFDEVVFYDI